MQPVSAPDFIDKAFKESPEGVSFRQWQPLDGMLDSMGRQLQGEDVLNHGGSSQGSQTAMDSPHRRMLSGGNFKTQAAHASVVSQSNFGLHAPQLYRSLLPVQRSQGKVKPTMAVTIQDLPTTCKMSIVHCKIHRAPPVNLETVQLLSVGPASESITLRMTSLLERRRICRPRESPTNGHRQSVEQACSAKIQVVGHRLS